MNKMTNVKGEVLDVGSVRDLSFDPVSIPSRVNKRKRILYDRTRRTTGYRPLATKYIKIGQRTNSILPFRLRTTR